MDLIKSKTKILDEEDSSEEKSKEDETLELFENLAQPRIKKAIKEETLKIIEDIKGYKESERNDLDRLIDSVE